MAIPQKFHVQVPNSKPYRAVTGATMTARYTVKSAITTPICLHLLGSSSGRAKAAICSVRTGYTHLFQGEEYAGSRPGNWHLQTPRRPNQQ